MRLHPTLMLALVLAACKDDAPTPDSEPVLDDSGPVEVVDNDGDGYAADEDCDDADPAVNPGAAELCDGLDNNCDGAADEGAADASAWYTDADGDGYGTGEPTLACEAPSGSAALDGDCNDEDSAYYPGADESDCADPSDYNCDGSVGYADNDGDGFPACEECDDGDAATNPSAAEVCDSLDNNCDGAVDEGVSSTWYADGDGDGFGDPDYSTLACTQPEGYAASADDCDDADAAVNPAATEVCNSLDDDCDGAVDGADEGLDTSTAATWYTDADGDGYGDPATGALACEQPSGAVADSADCDDSDGAVNPAAAELCDGLDNDCDGAVDPDTASGSATWYTDADGDGYGDPSTGTVACEQPSGAVADSADCDDSDGAVNPAAAELCDGVDNDCDGSIDPNTAADAATWYADLDGDGYGDPASTTLACSRPSGYRANSKDCDDADVTTYKGASELCDGVDNDCDGTLDNGVLGSGAACAASDCLEILLDQPSAASGTYSLDLCGTPTDTECDMSTDGGGWTLLFADDFDSGANSGWSSTSTTTCGSFGTILGGYGTFGGGTVSITLDSSCVAHTEAWVTADYIKIDSWDGETAYAQVDGTNVWSQSLYYYEGAEVCGWNRGWSGSYDSSNAVSATGSHSAASLVLGFGSTLNQDTGDESWGVDNVELWLR